MLFKAKMFFYREKFVIIQRFNSASIVIYLKIERPF